MKLAEYTIRNYGCIGPNGCRVVIDNIVVLIGPNNVGKTTLLEAYDVLSSNAPKVEEGRFPKVGDGLPIIEGVFKEVTTDDLEVFDKKWISHHPKYGECLRIKYEFEKPSTVGVKYTWLQTGETMEDGHWEKHGSGGFIQKLASILPKPHFIKPDMTNAEVIETIRNLIVQAAKDASKEDPEFLKGIETEIEALTNTATGHIVETIESICHSIDESIDQVFSGYQVGFEPKTKTPDLMRSFAKESEFSVKNPGGYNIGLDFEGSGFQRTFLWAAMKAIADSSSKTEDDKDTNLVLIIEEPESYMHPHAIRVARDVIYSIADIGGWQVMLSTHSPIFIDVSKDHTSLIRVKQDEDCGSRIFLTNDAAFTESDAEVLRMAYYCNPWINEFFYADVVLLVEGPTEQVVLNKLLSECELTKSVHVVNCMGKATIPTYMKILNHFGSEYVVLHDSDTPRTAKGAKNPAWTHNESILQVANSNGYLESGQCQLICSVPDFELAYFARKAQKPKPWNAMRIIESQDFRQSDLFGEVDNLVNNIMNHSHKNRYNSTESIVGWGNEWAADKGDQEKALWEINE